MIVPAGGDVEAVSAAVAGAEGVAQVGPGPAEPGPQGTLLSAVLEPDPYSTEAYDLIPGIRAAAREAGGPGVLVGGPSAIEYDVRQAAARDTRRDHPHRARRRAS